LPATTIELPIEGLAAAIEAMIDALAAQIEALGRHVAAGSGGALRRAIKTPIRAVPTSVEVILDAVAAHVEAALDCAPTVIDTLRGISEDLRGADQEPETEPYCAAFHDWPP